MKTILSILLTLLPFLAIAQAADSAQSQEYMQEIKAYQQKLNEEYSNPETSPLEEEDLKDFKGLPFFPIQEKYKVKARFVRTPGSKPFKMPTSNGRLPVYEKYGELHFQLEGQDIVLPVYQSHDLRKRPEYADYLFLPFKDLTNGNESYGGGRYLELRIPEGDSIIVDFNKAYNPYCAYSGRYSCPLVPHENRMKVRVPAGVMAPVEHH